MLTRILVVFSFLLISTSLIHAQSSDPAWLDDVRAQAAVELSCEVTYFVNIDEGELGGRKTFSARVQCADGRRFDATRTEPEETFEFRTCDTQVC